MLEHLLVRRRRCLLAPLTVQRSAVGRDAAPEEHDTLLRLDFASFALRCFRELNPGTRS